MSQTKESPITPKLLAISAIWGTFDSKIKKRVDDQTDIRILNAFQFIKSFTISSNTVNIKMREITHKTKWNENKKLNLYNEIV